MKFLFRLLALSVVPIISQAQADNLGTPGWFAPGTVAAIAASSSPSAGPPAPRAPYALGYTGYAGHGAFGTRCWVEPTQIWDGYGFAETRTRICR